MHQNPHLQTSTSRYRWSLVPTNHYKHAFVEFENISQIPFTKLSSKHQINLGGPKS